MNNLEYAKKYKRILCLTNESKICKLAYCVKNKTIDCSGDICSACEFFDVDKCIYYLLQEHKEPIKLKQWEYDLIKYHAHFVKFNDRHILMTMKNKGHFKDMNSVTDTSMIIEDILKNCEIVSDDYEGFEDCK